MANPMENFNLQDAPHSQIVSYLDTFELVSELNSLQIDQLTTYFKLYTVQPGINILTEGQKNQFFCLICEGHVDIIKSNASDKPTKVGTLGQGKILGEISFFDHDICSAHIVANTQVTLLLMDRTAFKTLCEEASFIALQILLTVIKNISQRLRQTTGKLVDFL